MIGEQMMNIVDKDTQQLLKTKQNLYVWCDADGLVHFDGPTIIKIIVYRIRPSTKVQLLQLQHHIESSRLTQYGNDVNDMLNAMEDSYNQIVTCGRSYGNYTLRIFQALLDDEMSKNPDFRAAILREKTDWELGRANVTSDSLILLARTLVNNLKGTRGGNKWDALDPREQRLMALTAKLSYRSWRRPMLLLHRAARLVPSSPLAAQFLLGARLTRATR